MRFRRIRIEIGKSLPVAETRRYVDDAAALAAAKIQHEYVLAIRHILRTEHITQKQYAEMLGQGLRMVGGKLRGEMVFSLADIGRAQVVLGNVHLLMKVNQRRRVHEWMAAEIEAISAGR